LLKANIADFDFFRSMTGRRSVEQIAECGLDVSAVQAFISSMPLSIPVASIPE
jgi:hypothetical protein